MLLAAGHPEFKPLEIKFGMDLEVWVEQSEGIELDIFLVDALIWTQTFNIRTQIGLSLSCAHAHCKRPLKNRDKQKPCT